VDTVAEREHDEEEEDERDDADEDPRLDDTGAEERERLREVGGVNTDERESSSSSLFSSCFSSSSSSLLLMLDGKDVWRRRGTTLFGGVH